MHAAARHALVERQHGFARFHAPQSRRHRAHVERLERRVEDVIHQPAKLAEQHADVLTALGHFETQEFFDSEREGVFLIHRGDIVETIEIRHCLKIRLMLDQFFGAAMQEADMRIDASDYLPVEIEYQSQNAVGGGMLRPEIERDLWLAGLAVFFQNVAHDLTPGSTLRPSGKMSGAPSHGDMKSKSRNSCTN